MFQPRYTITNKILANIKHIHGLVLELNRLRPPHTVRVELEREARAISTYASTSIEGNPLPLTDVKRILKSKPENIRTSEQEVLNYNQALETLHVDIRQAAISLTLGLILSTHKHVMIRLVPEYQWGKLRCEPVFVNDPQTRQTVYLPPDARDVPQLMDKLIAFTHSNKGTIDSLILAGIFHKQFVIIHPFMDGNGRTARLTTKVLLAALGLNTFSLFSFESYYNRNVTAYFEHVGVFGNYYEIAPSIDFTPWLEYFIDGIVDELLRVKKELSVSQLTPKSVLKPHLRKILHGIKQKGYITDRDYAKLVNRAKATRTLDFKKLIDMGLIVRRGKGRATYYQLK